MRTLFLLLVVGNLAAAAWLFLGDPVDMVREPGRLALQIEPERFHVRSEQDVQRQRASAEKEAASAAAALAEAPAVECVEIGIFPTDAAAHKLQLRLAALGLAERVTAVSADHGVRLRVTGLDPAIEVQIDAILRDFPKQELAHCVEAVRAH